MGIKAGLVGLPNVGKSTLFNALTKSSAPAENYPFCTIDPHLAITNVPDERLEKLRAIYDSQKIIPATMTFVDIAGLVKGAASGEGLGNQFLSHIREVDLILHVLRCFGDDDIIHSGDPLDPTEDYHIIIAELMLKDLESVERRLSKITQLMRAGKTKELVAEQELLNNIKAAIDITDAPKVRTLVLNSAIKTIPLLSAKNFLIIANIDESEIENDAYKKNASYQKLIDYFGESRIIPISARAEYELSQLEPEESQEMMGMIGLRETGLDRIIRRSYQELGLITFFTCGPKEIHAWPIPKSMIVRQAAGEIHSDLQRGFIFADVFNSRELFELGSEAKLREKGKLRTEGQDYHVQDGDIINVKFNV